MEPDIMTPIVHFHNIIIQKMIYYKPRLEKEIV